MGVKQRQEKFLDIPEEPNSSESLLGDVMKVARGGNRG